MMALHSGVGHGGVCGVECVGVDSWEGDGTVGCGGCRMREQECVCRFMRMGAWHMAV